LFFTNRQQFKQNAKHDFESLFASHDRLRPDQLTSCLQSREDKTVVATALQMPCFDIYQDQELTTHLLSNTLDSDQSLYLASGYFNLPAAYQSAILSSKNKINILCGSPESNGFYGSKGISSQIPHVYSYLALKFYQKAKTAVQMYEYFRTAWTWHSKGIWITGSPTIMTSIGSSNMNYRSVHRDLEAQLYIFTSNEHLSKQILHVIAPNLESRRSIKALLLGWSINPQE
jgi:phosphatidylserine/phosphatidylglycerophosphate/cardiolipin synthase-like enzyme